MSLSQQQRRMVAEYAWNLLQVHPDETSRFYHYEIMGQFPEIQRTPAKRGFGRVLTNVLRREAVRHWWNYDEQRFFRADDRYALKNATVEITSSGTRLVRGVERVLLRTRETGEWTALHLKDKPITIFALMRPKLNSISYGDRDRVLFVCNPHIEDHLMLDLDWYADLTLNLLPDTEGGAS